MTLTGSRFTIARLSGTASPPAVRLALITVVTGAVCLLLEPRVSWLGAWPGQWSLPVNAWIADTLGEALIAIKPLARAVSAALSYPMEGARRFLTALPWPLLMGLTTALGWYLGGLAMAMLGFFGLGFVLLTGYWEPSMNTLSLVTVSVPLALLSGAAIGILAHEIPRLKSAVQAVLDVMQTVPTFAYLVPLLFLFGFGPVVGLIASAIYAAPPMARNVMLGLERVDAEVREAAIMSGANRLQQLFLVELPSAMRQIMVGVNQCLMAALSMVIIAAVIGGFNDIGWEVLLTMRKARFGESLMAGLVIVAFAIILDRMSRAIAAETKRYDARISLLIVACTLVFTVLALGRLPDASAISVLDSVAAEVDQGLGAFTAAYGSELDGIKNAALFYILLPMRIGLDDAVLPFTWGIQWTASMSLALFAAVIVACTALAYRGRLLAGLVLLVCAGVLETGLTQLPWPFVLTAVTALAYRACGGRFALIACGLLLAIMLSGLWERALLSLYLSGTSVLICAVLGGALGLLSAFSTIAWRIIQPICDMLQTIPLFVFLIPVLMFFQIGEFSAFLAICAYAIVPMIRYTRHGLVSTPQELVEAAVSSGATPLQILWEVRLPWASPVLLLGLNQTILYAFSMLVIAALIGTTDLGQSIYLALGQADIGLGIAAGLAMAMLAFIADRLVQGFAADQRRALGL